MVVFLCVFLLQTTVFLVFLVDVLFFFVFFFLLSQENDLCLRKGERTAKNKETLGHFYSVTVC